MLKVLRYFMILYFCSISTFSFYNKTPQKSSLLSVFFSPFLEPTLTVLLTTELEIYTPPVGLLCFHTVPHSQHF